MSVSVYWSLYVCVCVCVHGHARAIDQSTSKKPDYVLDLSKLIVGVPLVLLGEAEPPTKFSKRGEGGL